MVDWGKSRRLGENTTLSLRHPPHSSHRLMGLWIRTSYQINKVGPVHSVGSRKDMGSLSDGVIGIFLWRNPSGRTMSLVSAQPLIEMGTSNISWGGGKGVQCVRLRTVPLSCVDCLEIWELRLPGNHRVSPGLWSDVFLVHSVGSSVYVQRVCVCVCVFIMVWSEIL